MRHGIVGSRCFAFLEKVDEYVDRLEFGDVVVSGGARGVDRRAEARAQRRGLGVLSFRPVADPGVGFRIDPLLWFPDGGWSVSTLPGAYPNYGAAAFVRNRYIVESSDLVTAFWDGQSRGTKDSIARAREVGNLGDIVRG